MQPEDLVFVATCDLAGQVRGKAFPAADLDRRLVKGVGYTHSNIMMSAFGPIGSSPFGTEGDLMLVPDPTTRVDVRFDEGVAERFYLGDLCDTGGRFWECCPRHFLRRALEALHRETGLRLRAAFEQEFVYTGIEHNPSATYGLDAYRRQGSFGELFLGALRSAGVTPDSFLPEYGPRQFEVTVKPQHGLRAADEAVMVRELGRAVAWRLGHKAMFAPMIEPDGIGNGTHVHFSLEREDGTPALYDASDKRGLSQVGRCFAAGLLRHMPALCAVATPSVASYLRLTPNRWAPTWANIAVGDRGASLRVCPNFAPKNETEAALQFNLEYRVVDASASPYMALGAIVFAGLDGIMRREVLPDMPLRGFWDLDEAARKAVGARRLPSSLGAALDALAATPEAASWFGERLLSVYLEMKRSEIEMLAGLDEASVCARYAAAY